MTHRLTVTSRKRGEIVGILTQRFSTFTILEGAAYVSGRKDYALVIEFTTDNEEALNTTLKEIKEQGEILTHQTI